MLRRRLSTAIVKSNMSVLLGRLGMIGEGAALARKRRQWAATDNNFYFPPIISEDYLFPLRDHDKKYFFLKKWFKGL